MYTPWKSLPRTITYSKFNAFYIIIDNTVLTPVLNEFSRPQIDVAENSPDRDRLKAFQCKRILDRNVPNVRHIAEFAHLFSY